MPTRKQLGGNTITDDDPLQVAITAPALTAAGAPTKVTVTTASTEIVAADPDRTWSVLVTIYSGGPVFIREGAAATVNDFPLVTGTTIEHASTAALNGIVASGSADVRTWPNGGTS